ncbi:tobamovirus multiplication protein 1 [Beta vulgaris subsp. vulgaris]|uniref:tobamovirus multiplication protein 1 n=1 Tax=Beta vulgaris subsp. vulgaris TaxID=3555 RepID=UPI002036B15A|nr:tobamovirus multiplication protein 1 [Beta vulgaris subsp. vulgaris]
MGRMKDLMVIEGSDTYEVASNWWNKIMETQKDPKNGVYYYILCASYALVAMVALVQLVRIQMRVPEYGWTTQKAFHLMNFVVNGLRAILFGSYKKVFRIRPHVFEIILLDLPGLLFFSTYTMLVLFWAEIYHQARSLPTDRLRPAYYIVNVVVYIVQLIIWICMRLSKGHAALEAAKLFFSVISLSAAFGFLIYGGRLFFMLKRFPIESVGRQKKLHEVGVITTICCTCFLVGCIVAAISAFDDDFDVDVLDHPLGNLLYYMVVEILPSALVLFVLRKLPSRRISDQYQAIQ